MRIKKANAILKRPVSKLLPIEYAYDTNETEKAREQKLRWEAVVIVELKRKYDKTREIFPSVTRALSILTTAATSASVERVNSKERVPKVPCSIPAVNYAQRWANVEVSDPANVEVSVKQVEVVERI